jgi:putative SOS response-associated peptidase YedK
VPVDGFFEWQAIKGARAKQPYAIAMKDGSPFGLARVWENWRHPTTGEWERTFAIITVPSNELVGQIHERRQHRKVLMVNRPHPRRAVGKDDTGDWQSEALRGSP